MDAAGARRAQRPEEIQTSDVLVTAHGTSNRVRLQLEEQGLTVHDATCPLVKRAHLALARLVEEGRHPVVIGQRNHVEVRGLVGDLDDYTVVLSEEDFGPLEGRPRLGVVAQTTQPLERVEALVETLRRRFPTADIRFIDTVCQPTKDRQEALHRLAEACEVVVVVGGPDSNNSRKLTELARKLGRAAYQVAAATQLRKEWFRGVRVVGLTAGTSTPDPVIHEVRAWLEALE
jgi:4-hydroxy-3-methylbut-2-enyl diphosphate reductase